MPRSAYPLIAVIRVVLYDDVAVGEGRPAAGGVDIRLRRGYANDQGGQSRESGETSHILKAEREFRHEKERGQNSKNIEQ